MNRALALVCVVLFLVWQSGLSTPTRVSIVRPIQIVTADTYVRYMVQVEPRDENRMLVLAAVDEGGAVRSSREQLDGDRAPRTRWIVWQHGLPAGDYMVIAAVFNSQREVARASVPVTVMSRF